ncbi:MAG: MarC family protein [Candidatus Atribacteria bacterium]|nr:MarC family protein [Candidatus Atribacteria bacterium]MCD6349267.1 MarC family protein [Candidatus Atribacteria bacterium]
MGSRGAVDLFFDFIKSFLLLTFILDPFLGAMVFIALTKDMEARERSAQAFLAVSVAFVLLVVFLFIGKHLFSLLGISFSSFMVAGGVILLLLGIEEILGLEFSKRGADTRVAAIVIGTPLLCGPGAITSVIILSQKYGYLMPFLAVLSALALTWLILYFANHLSRLLGERIIEVFSRVMGLLLAAIAVEYIKEGILQMISEIAVR